MVNVFSVKNQVNSTVATYYDFSCTCLNKFSDHFNKPLISVLTVPTDLKIY